MCSCVNVKMGSYDNQVELPRPKCMIGRTEGSSNPKTICVDKCIAEEVQYLWSCSIRTTGCGCGHNITEGYIGVIDKDVEFMKKSGYKVRINKDDLSDEKNFIPKSHYKGDKLEYYEYEVLYKKGGINEDTR